MNDQISLFGASLPEKSCYNCGHFSELKEPRKLDGEGAIFGYCFKGGTKPSSINMGKGFAVYLPDGSCKSWVKRRKVR